MYLCADEAMLRRQLDGERLGWRSDIHLLDHVSTDEIIPAWACFYYDGELGRFALTGLRGQVVGVEALRKSGATVLVCGQNKGCGSSRETAPYAELAAGIQLVFARSFAKIYRQNCTNLGLVTCTDWGILERLESGEEVSFDELTRDLDPISRQIVGAGGLLAWQANGGLSALRPADVPTASADGDPRGSPIGGLPQTFVEKVLCCHGRRLDGTAPNGVEAGETLLLRAHWRFSHDYTTAMAAAQFSQGYGEKGRVSEPSTVLAFRDHLADVDAAMSQDKRRLGLLDRAFGLGVEQRRFCSRQGIRVVDVEERGGFAGICHNYLLDEVVEPGQVVVGTDSHTCTAGAIGALAIGVGSTDIAFAWASGLTRVTVPESVRVELCGSLGSGVCAKDIMLALLARPRVRSGELVGCVIEFCGEALRDMPLDELATLTNMAVEAGAFSAVVTPEPHVLAKLAAVRGVAAERLACGVVRPDAGARYRTSVALDVTELGPMVALPGDPHNGQLLDALSGRDGPRVDIAYGGSCTGGKASDMDMYAAVFSSAAAAGERIASHVSCYIQFGSHRVRRYAEQRGYAALFERMGATLLAPGCGACIGAGTGVSTRADQVTVSAVNRNFPGRSGPGQVYLASPYVVAASAIAGRLCHPARFVPNRPIRRGAAVQS